MSQTPKHLAVVGATGAVGNAAMQLAKIKGAKVLAAVSSLHPVDLGAVPGAAPALRRHGVRPDGAATALLAAAALRIPPP